LPEAATKAATIEANIKFIPTEFCGEEIIPPTKTTSAVIKQFIGRVSFM